MIGPVKVVLEGFAPPEHPGLAPMHGEVDYVGTFGRMLAATNTRARLGLRLAVWLAALSPLWHQGRLCTMARLPIDERAQLLSALLSHRWYLVRELLTLLKFAASLALFAEASVRARSQYDATAAVEESGERLRLPLSAEVPLRRVSSPPGTVA